MRPRLRAAWFRTFLLAAVVGAGGAAAGADEPGRYDGHKLVRVQIASARDFQRMLRISDDVWSEHPDIGPVDFRVPPEGMAALADSGLPYEVLVDDLQARADEERARLANPSPDAGWFDDFKDLAAIEARMDELAALRPDLAQTFVVGNSLEGRPIRGIRITSSAGGGRRKRGMLFASTQHAREWIAPMVTMYLADALVTRYDTDLAVRRVVDQLEFFIVPVVNVDGYVYTWPPTAVRYWRKNRRPGSCYGVDLNRNWGYEWVGGGSSTNPCSETYRGTAPFSEPETAALRDFVQARPGIRYVHDMHSYGRYLLQPWGFTPALPPGHATFDFLGQTMQRIIQAVHGMTYVHGPTYTTLYPVNGDLSDWAWGAEHAYSFVFELRGNDFVLPPSEIIPNSEEILPAALWLANWILRPLVPVEGGGPLPTAFGTRNGLRER